MAEFLNLLCAMVILGGFVSAAVWDITTRTIPNTIVVVIFLAVLGLLLLEAPSSLPIHGAVALAVLAAGVVLFSLRIWGAGDAKLLTAAALACGARGLPALILATALFGGILALLWLAARHLPWRNGAAFATVPYGVAIAFGAIIASAGSDSLGPLTWN